MAAKKRAEDLRRNSERYLRDTEHGYILNLASMLYQPRSQGSSDCGSMEPPDHTDSTRPKGSWADWLNAGIGVVGLFVSVITLIGLGFTVIFAREQWVEAKRTADASIEAAKAAVLSDKNTEKFFRTDERAWVELEPIRTTVFMSHVPIFETVYNYQIFPKNVGKTLARNVAMRVADSVNGPWIVGESEGIINNEQDKILMGKFKDNTGKSIPFENDHPVAKVLAPGSSSPIPFPAHGPAPVKSGNTINYGFLIGRIDYIDAFDIPHWMKFCFVIFNAEGELANCKYGNDEDRNSEDLNRKK